MIIMSCSDRKNRYRDAHSAIDVYDGQFYSILKNFFVEYPDLEVNTEVLIVSAKYGLIRSTNLISYYDLKMDSEIAESQKDSNTKKLLKYIEKYKPEKILVVMGETYLESIDWKQVTVPVTYVKGKIGVMMHKLKGRLKTIVKSLK